MIAATLFFFRATAVPAPAPAAPADPIAEKQLHEKINAAMRAKEVIVGMTEAEVLGAWGEPEEKKLTPTSTGIKAEWVYPNGRTVNFHQGKVTTFKAAN